MNKKALASILAVALITATLTGCEQDATKEAFETAMAQNMNIKVTENTPVSTTEREQLNWIELDKLRTNPELRNTWDDNLNLVKFDNGSKNGSIYIDPEGNWTSNSVLYYAFQNKEFVKNYWEDRRFTSAISEKAEEVFSDITNVSTGLYAAVNAYYDILPKNTDGTSGLLNYISRKEAMSAICRADTPVKDVDTTKFDGLFGQDMYNPYASQLENESYFKTSDGSLNAYTYNAAITKVEAVYMIVQRYFKDEYDAMVVNGNPFTDCKNAGSIFEKYEVTPGYAWETYSLEYCLQNPSVGVTEDLFKALLVGYRHGFVGNTTNWNKSILGGDMLSMLINAYKSMYSTNYPVNAKTGYNDGDKIHKDDETGTGNKEEETIGGLIPGGANKEQENNSEETNNNEETNNSDDSSSTSEETKQ